MTVLGIESSCDETGAAILKDGVLLSNVVNSQVEIHRRFGGVVPEVASRQHLQNIAPVVSQALSEAGVTWADVDGIAVTKGPGLAGCLLVGLSYAKAIASALAKPIVGVNHLEGHLMAPFLDGEEPEFPLVALLVSGGHTSLIYAEEFGVYQELGCTRDDAAGEAFDKVGKLLGLGYPAGAEIDRLAVTGDREAIKFPRAMLKGDNLEFSFSGLKTAVLNHVRKHGVPEGQALSDLCASFQEAVVEVLVRKALRAIRQTQVETLIVSGGVSANSRLREAMAQACGQREIDLQVSPLSLCADNGAMIACAGAYRLERGERASQSLSATSRMPLSAEKYEANQPPGPGSHRGSCL